MSILFVTSGLLIIFQGMGQARNPSTLDSDRLAFHSSRISRTGPHARSLSLSLSLSLIHTHTHPLIMMIIVYHLTSNNNKNNLFI